MSTRSLLFWTGVSLGAHLLLFAFAPTWHSGVGKEGREIPVHLFPRRPPVSPSLPPVGSAAVVPPPPSQERTPAPLAPPALASPPAPESLPAPVPGPTPFLTGSAPTTSAESAAPPTDDAVPIDPPAADGAAPAAVAGATGGEEQTALPPMERAAPLYERNPPPPYPRLAQARGWDGEVLLRVRVSVSGEVLEATIEQSSGHGILDRAAGKAVRGWRFRPGRQGGMPVESEVVVPVVYRLEGR